MIVIYNFTFFTRSHPVVKENTNTALELVMHIVVHSDFHFPTGRMQVHQGVILNHVSLTMIAL